MGNSATSRTGSQAVEEVTRDYYKQSAHIRRLLGLSPYAVTVRLHKVWEPISMKPTQGQRLKALKARLGVTRSDPKFCHDFVELMLGRPPIISDDGALVKRTVKCCNETLEGLEGCFCFPVFLAWIWVLASASPDTICSIAFRLYDNKTRAGFVTTDDDAERILENVSGTSVLHASVHDTIRARKHVHNHFQVMPLLNRAEKCMDEESFVRLARVMTQAGALNAVSRLQARARLLFGKHHWTELATDTAHRCMKQPAFREALLHNLQAQCTCLTEESNCGDAGLAEDEPDEANMREFTDMSAAMTATSVTPDAAGLGTSPSSDAAAVKPQHKLTKFGLRHGHVNKSAMNCGSVPTFQYLLNLGGVAFEPTVDGYGHLMDASVRPKAATAMLLQTQQQAQAIAAAEAHRKLGDMRFMIADMVAQQPAGLLAAALSSKTKKPPSAVSFTSLPRRPRHSSKV